MIGKLFICSHLLQKLYQNKFLRDAASLGLSFEEAEARRKKRSERFQSPLLKKNEEKTKEAPDELIAQSQFYIDKISKFNEKLSCKFADLLGVALIFHQLLSMNGISIWRGV